MRWSRHSAVPTLWRALVEMNSSCWRWKPPAKITKPSFAGWREVSRSQIHRNLDTTYRSVSGWRASIQKNQSRSENSWYERTKICTNRKKKTENLIENVKTMLRARVIYRPLGGG